MPDFDTTARALATGGDWQAILDALKAAFDEGLETAARPLDARVASGFARAGAAMNNTEMQIRSGEALRAQNEARRIRSLKFASASRTATPSAARTY